MDAATAWCNDVELDEDESFAVEAIERSCARHPGMATLTNFNEHLSGRALVPAERLLFLAIMAAFNRHTVGGIAILAGRLSDEVLPLLPRTGHRIGATVLDAAVDEYGLRDGITHVELARDFGEFLGISLRDIEEPRNACPQALALGQSLCTWYREAPVAYALGVHLASEATSMTEFMAWHEIFLKFPQYSFTRDTAQFAYLRAHFVHEPEHMRGARSCLTQYLDVLPGNGRLLKAGATRYLDRYQTMFHELDTLIFK